MNRRLHLKSWVILAFVVAALSVACDRGEEALTPVQPPVTSPAVEIASPTDPPKEAPASAAPAPVFPTPAPAVQDSEKSAGSLRVRSTRATSAPSQSVLLGVGGLHLSPIGQNLGNVAGLTVSAIGSVTAAADEAYVVIVPEQRFGPSGREQMSSEDRADIIQSLADIGIEEDAIDFESLGRYGSSSISVEVALGELDAKGAGIVEAVEEIVRHSESHGVRFTLSPENCDSARALARREAIPSAEEAAQDLANALGLELGVVAGALEYPLTPSPYGLLGGQLDPCGQGAEPFANFAPLDSEPEVEVSVGLQVTYGIR